MLLRDNHGIAQVSTVTGSKVLRILKGHGAFPGLCTQLRRQLERGESGGA